MDFSDLSLDEQRLIEEYRANKGRPGAEGWQPKPLGAYTPAEKFTDPPLADLVETVLRLAEDQHLPWRPCPYGTQGYSVDARGAEVRPDGWRGPYVRAAGNAAPALARAIQTARAEYRTGYEAGLRGDLRGQEGEWRQRGAEHGYAVYCQRSAEKRVRAAEAERESLRVEVERLRRAIHRGASETERLAYSIESTAIDAEARARAAQSQIADLRVRLAELVTACDEHRLTQAEYSLALTTFRETWRGQLVGLLSDRDRACYDTMKHRVEEFAEADKQANRREAAAWEAARAALKGEDQSP